MIIDLGDFEIKAYLLDNCHSVDRKEGLKLEEDLKKACIEWSVKSVT